MNKGNPTQRTDRELGMGRDIPRRDFLNGAALTIGAALLPGLHSNKTKSDEPQNHPGYNPPVSPGLRGSHTGSFEIAHSLRDGTFWKDAAPAQQLAEKYDLIIVGGGISGLAAAHFYRERAGAIAKILSLENHDDFGGHAKRNEFHLGGKQLLNGGTMLIDRPELARKNWRLSESAFAGRTDLAAHEPYAVQTRTSRARATQGGKDGASGDAV